MKHSFNYVWKLVGTPLAILFCLLTAIASFAFYTTPFGDQVEEYLFDVRTRLKPLQKNVSDIVLVTIDEGTIERLREPGKSQVKVGTLFSVVEVLRASKARQVAVLFFFNIFDFEDPLTPLLVESVAKDERFFMGTIANHIDTPSGTEFPSVLRPVQSRTFGVDTLKKRSNSVVRVLPMHGYQGLTLRPMLPGAMALSAVERESFFMAPPRRLVSGAILPLEEWYALNFLEAESFRQIDAADLLERPADFLGELEHKTVLVGQTAFREWVTQTRDQMLTNTPLKGHVDSYRDGEPLLFVTANALENLMTGTWLRSAPVWVVVLQAAFTTAVCGGVWALGVVPAVLIVLFGWWLLLLFHGLLFHFGGVFVPLADAAFYSAIAVLIGAVARLNLDVQSRAIMHTETEAKLTLARAQSRYLERFARAMAAANKLIASRLGAIVASNPTHPMDVDLLGRAVFTCADFSEYLDGIMQSAIAEGVATQKFSREKIRLDVLFETVVRRFETKIAERNMEIVIDCQPGLVVRSNAQLLDNIVFNLVSNAVRYSPADARIFLSAEAAKRGVVIRVTDEGPGIAPEFQEKIFEKFYRVKNDSVYKIQGTGLGLYLCRYFAERIDATVRCESTLGHGATFIVELGRRL